MFATITESKVGSKVNLSFLDAVMANFEAMVVSSAHPFAMRTIYQ